jgi:hypothetical protein
MSKLSIELVTRVTNALFGKDGKRLVIERKSALFDEAVNRLSGGGYCRTAVESIILSEFDKAMSAACVSRCEGCQKVIRDGKGVYTADGVLVCNKCAKALRDADKKKKK